MLFSRIFWLRNLLHSFSLKRKKATHLFSLWLKAECMPIMRSGRQAGFPGGCINCRTVLGLLQKPSKFVISVSAGDHAPKKESSFFIGASFCCHPNGSTT